jgi:hypothetical protein
MRWVVLIAADQDTYGTIDCERLVIKQLKPEPVDTATSGR